LPGLAGAAPVGDADLLRLVGRAPGIVEIRRHAHDLALRLQHAEDVDQRLPRRTGRFLELAEIRRREAAGREKPLDPCPERARLCAERDPVAGVADEAVLAD